MSDRSAGRSAAPISSGNPVFSPNPALTNNGQVDSGGVILKLDPSLPQAVHREALRLQQEGSVPNQCSGPVVQSAVGQSLFDSGIAGSFLNSQVVGPSSGDHDGLGHSYGRLPPAELDM